MYLPGQQLAKNSIFHSFDKYVSIIFSVLALC